MKNIAGDTITWTTKYKQKTGIILQHVPAGENIDMVLRNITGEKYNSILRSALKIGNDVSINDRYLVECNRNGKTYYYAPRVVTIQNQKGET